MVADTHRSSRSTLPGFLVQSAVGNRTGWPVLRSCRLAAVHDSPAKQLKRRKNYCPVHSTLQSQNGE